MTPTACVACGEAFAADATRCDVPGNYGNSQRCVPCDLVNQANIADSYAHMGWHDEATGDALGVRRQIYERRLGRDGAGHEGTILAGSEVATALWRSKRFGEAAAFLRVQVPLARATMGPDDDLALTIVENLCIALRDADAARADLAEAETMLEETLERRRRVAGPAAATRACEETLATIRAKLRPE